MVAGVISGRAVIIWQPYNYRPTGALAKIQVRQLLFQQLRRVVLGIDLADGIDDDALFVDDIGGA